MVFLCSNSCSSFSWLVSESVSAKMGELLEEDFCRICKISLVAATSISVSDVLGIAVGHDVGTILVCQ